MTHRALTWTAVVAALVAITVWIGGVVANSPIPLALWQQHPGASWTLSRGENPNPVQLKLPPSQPLSAVALLGRQLFFDASLSGSGKLSCASCHQPGHAYAPDNALPVQLGGGDMHTAGLRAVPSLTYLYRQPAFNIGPTVDDDDGVTLLQLVERGKTSTHASKTVHSAAQQAHALVPQGGLFWDGRVNTLQQQAGGPLFNPLEMDAGTPQLVLQKLRKAGYAKDFEQLFGPAVLLDDGLALSEAMFAIGRFQYEDASFHAFSSKYDAWLQGRARFSAEELRGYLAFADPQRGNCAACHPAQPSPDGLPPLFTDHQYEALGLPRNPEIPANRDPAYHDLGLCGPQRADLKEQTQYCGMFLTPTLRNAATRRAFFHNGVMHRLEQVLDFYNQRDTAPDKVYPPGADGKPALYNDLPPAFHANIDRSDAPMNRHPGDAPAMSAQDMRDIIAFLQTLVDGYGGKP